MTRLWTIVCAALLALGIFSFQSHGQPTGDMSVAATTINSGATAFRIEAELRHAGPLYAEIGGHDIQVAEAAFSAWLLNDGKRIAYSAADGAGGYENEGQSLYIYDVGARTSRKVLSSYYVIDEVIALKTRQGRQGLLVKMRDGGLGASHLAVVDPRRGPVFLRQQAKLLTRQADWMVLGYYHEADWERMTETMVQPYKTERHDVNELLKQPAMVNTPVVP